MNDRTRRLPVAILVSALALAPACSRVENPATGRSEYTTLSAEQERELGAHEHPRILQQFGGAYSDEELQAYVQAVGNRVAANSDQPDAEFTFTLLDSEVPNAFALPGSYVYITRGLLALAETEAEMAGVLGHEIGHVTARHTAQRQTQATGAGVLATLATIAAAVLGGEVAGQLAQQGHRRRGPGLSGELLARPGVPGRRSRRGLHDRRRLRPGGDGDLSGEARRRVRARPRDRRGRRRSG